ncbi:MULTISPECIES: purple acid phosphatase family protein [Spongiibacter]|uniref:purple acid phosphatase family protein n=1 Tax=Spongiibacter TaxID=630749 RepID=UPI000C4BD5DE|nr:MULTISPECIES: metallophosphoesterase family protein [Spongiibacter]MAY38899.1 serine/threonine protein phosphatase [Spongiibacter sp.]MBI56985.1 serine/threonine protein phosphatase [Spongiibacter sp.]|tara:strand:- start:2640 stop:4118 length:1479 start_codon:yes stop_codon:yes gene_type:complete
MSGPSNPWTRRRFVAAGMAGLVLSACNGGSGSSGGGTNTPTPDTEDPGPYQPRGIHASFTEDSHSSRSITWFTDGLDAPYSRMEYGSVDETMSDADIADRVFEFSVDASAAETTGVDALTHRATATGIDPEKPMRYRVGSDDGGWSPVYVIPPSPSGEWSFIHFGDHGIGEMPQMLTAEVMKNPSDLLLLAGDLSYADGEQAIWDTWFDQMQPLMSQRITMAAPGNHEQKDFDGDTFKNRFTHPPKPLTSGINPDGPGTTFYSFDYNRVHFLVTTAGALINDGTLPEELLNIEVDLAQAALRRARGEIDFIVVMQHYTIWTDQDGRSPMNPALVLLEENILLRYGVDLLAVGHDHVYQRSEKMGFGLPNPLGYVQVLVGTGGQSIRIFDDNGPQIWSASEFVGVGYCKYFVSPGKIRGEYYGAPPLDMSDEGRQYTTGEFALRDSFEIDARSQLACEMCVLPARGPDILLADFEAISRHTRERNHRILSHHC